MPVGAAARPLCSGLTFDVTSRTIDWRHAISRRAISSTAGLKRRLRRLKLISVHPAAVASLRSCSPRKVEDLTEDVTVNYEYQPATGPQDAVDLWRIRRPAPIASRC